jgi:non-specific serine/threonine protein kinase
MELLALLLERPRELVSRDEIAQRLWPPDVFVDLEAGIHTAVLRIRQVLGDARDSPKFIETVSGKGYRFVAPVVVVPVIASGGRHADRRHNLPAELTSFVGRRTELATLPARIADTRLLSLTGPGGVGKTRLAVRLAERMLDSFRDGVWMVDVASLADADLLPQAIATALGVREGGPRTPLEALIEFLRGREVLLVLDTCEHLIDASARLVDALLREAPGLRVVATSREALAVSGEVVYRVPSLSLPESPAATRDPVPVDSEAVELFIERARAVDSAFRVPSGEEATVASICRRLDGIPLAIELAAARVVVLSLPQIESRLDDRFRLLTGGRAAVARQRTLEATVHWSCQLLSEAERELLSRLSVFPAAWGLDAAEGICGGDGIDEADTLELLSRLVAKSLVAVEHDPSGGRRYRLLEMVRQYALERLMEAGAVDRLRARHFEFFYDEFRSGHTSLRDRTQGTFVRRLAADQDNVRAALEWAFAGDGAVDRGVELAGALFWFWTKRGQFAEGRRWLERALGAGQVAPPLRARALIGLAHMSYFQGRYPEAGSLVAEALALGRGDNDAWVVSFALFLQALASLEQGELDLAAAAAGDARDAATASGDAWQHGGPLLVLASVAVARGAHEKAQTLYEESIDVHRQTGDVWGLGVLLSAAAALAVVQSRLDEAFTLAAEASSIAEELDDPRGIAWSLEALASLAAAHGLTDRAVRCWGASEALLDGVGSSLAPTIGWVRERFSGPARQALGADAFESLRRQGRTLSPALALALAREPYA